MRILILLTILTTNCCFAEIYQWKDKKGSIHYSDEKPGAGEVVIKEIQLKEPVVIEGKANKNYVTKIISWEVTSSTESYINLAVKYHYDGKYKDNKTWISAYTMENGARSMNYSVRPAKMDIGTGIVNIRVAVKSRAPKRHCTNKIGLTMYGKDIPTFHKATINFSKCWTNNYITPSESNPTKGIK